MPYLENFSKNPWNGKKGDSRLLKSIRMGGIRHLNENWSQIIMINVSQQFEKSLLCHISSKLQSLPKLLGTHSNLWRDEIKRGEKHI